VPCDRIVLLARCSNNCLSFNCVNNSFFNLLAQLFALPQNVYRLFVVKDVSLRLAQDLQNSLFNVGHLLVVFVLHLNESHTFVFDHFIFHLYDEIKELVTQDLVGNHKVDNCHFCSQFWLIVWVHVFCCHIKLELVCIIDFFVTEANFSDALRCECLLEKHRVKQWVHLLTNAFEQHRKTHSDGLFKLAT